MIRRAAPAALAAFLLLLPAPLRAESEAARAAEAAAAALEAAIDTLQEAEGARDRVAALTLTIRAYEDGLIATRDGLRRVSIREQAIRKTFDAKRERVQRLLGVMTAMGGDPAPVLLLHPSGPVGTVRSGMILSDVTPAMQAEVQGLRTELEEIAALRSIQQSATGTLERGLTAVQEARTALSQAISDRRDLPRRFTEDPAVLRALLESYDTLDAFAHSLAGDDVKPGVGEFAEAKGELELPAQGSVLRKFREADAAGIRRPGMLIATRPRALVTTPWPATIRYLGPLLDYGNVMILEPAGGYLLVLAGLDVVYGDVGQVIPAGTPVGLMGGAEAETQEFLQPMQDGGGKTRQETLYIELRQGGTPVNPEEWFAQTRMFP